MRTLFGTALIAMGAIGIVDSTPLALSIPLMVIGSFCISTIISPNRPTVRRQGGRTILLNPITRIAMAYQMGTLAAFGVVLIWSWAAGAIPVFGLVTGIAILAVTVAILVEILREWSRRTLCFGPESIRITFGHRFDAEFDWSKISGLDITTRRLSDGRYLATIVFTCPADAVRYLGKAKKSPYRLIFESDGVWHFKTSGWTVDPNSLLATMKYFVRYPDRRAGLATESIAAMLTPPRDHRQISRLVR